MGLTEMIIKTATPDLVDEMYGIELKCFSCPWSKNAYRQLFENGIYNTLVSVDEGNGNKITGLIVSIKIEKDAEILNLCVLPEYRGMGIASSLLKRALEDMIEGDTVSAYLEVRESNDPARSLYRKYGFTEYGIRKSYYSNPRENAVLMHKSL